MHPLNRTRAYWGPLLVGILASLALWGIYRSFTSTGGWLDIVPAVLVCAVAGVVSAAVVRPEHWGWGGGLLGLAGLLVTWVGLTLGTGYVAPIGTVHFAMFVGVMALLMGAPFLGGFALSRLVLRSWTHRGTSTSQA